MNPKLPKGLAALIIVVAGAALILSTVYITKNGDYLWSFILLLWGLQVLPNSSKKGGWSPTITAAIMAILYTAIGVVVYITNNGDYLWSMILANWVAEQIAGYISN